MDKFPWYIKPKDCKPEHVTEFAQAFWIDGMFNAFHCRVIDHILPYSTRFDRKSWWYSQLYVIVRSDDKFHGQVVADPRIRARNTQHHPYAKERNWGETIKIVAEDVRNEVPDKFLNISEPLLEQWMEHYKDKFPPDSTGDFYCSNPPLKPNSIRSYSPYTAVCEDP